MLYSVGKVIMRIVLFFVFRRVVIGQENVPEEGGAIYAVNHRSNWDVVMAGLACPRKLRFMAKSELFQNKLFGGLIRRLGAFPVRRGRGDIGAVRSAVKILSGGEMMLMFPEGRRVRNEEEQQRTDAKAGIALIAATAKVPVIPVYISGKYRWMSKITVVMGEPISLEEYYHQELTIQELQDLSNDILRTMRTLKVK